MLHIVGGGTQNELLNQFTANATGKIVITGPTEATVIGNSSVQFVASGELENIAQARQIITQMDVTRTYLVQDTSKWEIAYQKLLEL